MRPQSVGPGPMPAVESGSSSEVGSSLPPTELIDGDPGITLRVAMAALADLDEDVFTSPPVLDAARAARHALRRLG